MSGLHPWDGLKISFERRCVSAFLGAPHRVLSSCRALGGQREDIECICNHQICEPVGHMGRISASAYDDPAAYLAEVTRALGLPEKTALLVTAANAQCAGQALREEGGQAALAVATAGVDGNAARAGDPPGYAETPEGVTPLTPGTINIMLFLNSAVTPGAMLEAAMLCAEAKASVLQELSVPSLYSDGLATGTGTDGLALAAPLAGKPLLNAGKHARLGSLIGRAVRAAVAEALARQNSMLPAMRCNVLKLMGRFGLDAGLLAGAARALLPEADAKTLLDNLTGLVTDPQAAAAAAALAHIEDQFAWGVLPAAAREDAVLDYAALLAARASGRLADQPLYREELAVLNAGAAHLAAMNAGPAPLAAAALALGFRDKWK